MSPRTSFLVIALSIVVAGCGAERRPVERADPGATVAIEQREAAGLIVDVAGAVRRPGVYEVPAGARVHEAITAAGGLRSGADVSSLNRAAVIADGQQIVVATRSAAGADVADMSGGDGPVSINAADVSALDTLPGIGPVTAQHIVDERESNGPFASIDDLDRVSGIGPATIESLREVATT